FAEQEPGVLAKLVYGRGENPPAHTRRIQLPSVPEWNPGRQASIGLRGRSLDRDGHPHLAGYSRRKHARWPDVRVACGPHRRRDAPASFGRRRATTPPVRTLRL